MGNVYDGFESDESEDGVFTEMDRALSMAQDIQSDFEGKMRAHVSSAVAALTAVGADVAAGEQGQGGGEAHYRRMQISRSRKTGCLL